MEMELEICTALKQSQVVDSSHCIHAHFFCVLFQLQQRYDDADDDDAKV